LRPDKKKSDSGIERGDSITKHQEENKDLKMNLKNMVVHDENRNWHEIRVVGKHPERRGYHSSFLSHKK